MKHLTEIRISKKIQALAAALAVSATVMSLAPGEAEAKPKRDNGVRCAFTHSDGFIEFVVPGDSIYVPGFGSITCGNDGGFDASENVHPPMEGGGGRPGSGGGRGGRGGRGK